MSITDRKPEIPAANYSQEDWDEVSDNPELTEEELAQLRPAGEMPKHIFEALPKRGPGRPKVEAPKIQVKPRVDPAVVEAYKAGGPRLADADARGAGPWGRDGAEALIKIVPRFRRGLRPCASHGRTAVVCAEDSRTFPCVA